MFFLLREVVAKLKVQMKSKVNFIILSNFIFNEVSDSEIEPEAMSRKKIDSKDPKKLEVNEENTIFVSNLASDTDEDQLHKLFSQVNEEFFILLFLSVVRLLMYV